MRDTASRTQEVVLEGSEGDLPSGTLGFSSVGWDGKGGAPDLLSRLNGINQIKYQAYSQCPASIVFLPDFLLNQ